MKNNNNNRLKRILDLKYDFEHQPKCKFLPCNLCGSDAWVIITQRDRYGFPATATTCTKCGLTTLNPRMTQEGYARFYKNVYRPLVSAYHGRRIDAKSIQIEQIPYANSFKEFAKPFINANHKTMLDVGGSTGIVANHFANEFGLKATVIDPAPAETAEAQVLGIENITGFIEEWDAKDRRFDIIGIFQTIDHLFDIKLTLKKLRNLISKDGFLFLDIVDFRAAIIKNSSVEAAIKIDHVYSLTEKTTEAFLTQAGFEWRRKSYSADNLHVAYVCSPTEANPNAIPELAWVERHFDEIRRIQVSR